MTKKKSLQIIFNVKNPTPARQIFQIPGHWDVGCSPCVCVYETSRRCSYFSDCEGLVSVSSYAPANMPVYSQPAAVRFLF